MSLSLLLALAYLTFASPLRGAPVYSERYVCQIPCNGAEGTRTPDLFLAKEAFSQLNYGPRLIGLTRIRWAFVDSNHRPSPYQRDALTN